MLRKHYLDCKVYHSVVRKRYKKDYPCSISLVLYSEYWRPTSCSFALGEGHHMHCVLLRVRLQRSRVRRVLITAHPK